jgi:putative transposase
MPEYRRNLVPGGTFFFTLNLLDRRSDLLVAQVDVLREAVRRTRLRSPFRIDVCAVLPDHPLPRGDADFPGRWRAIEIAFVKYSPRGEPKKRGPYKPRRSQG